MDGGPVTWGRVGGRRRGRRVSTENNKNCYLVRGNFYIC